MVERGDQQGLVRLLRDRASEVGDDSAEYQP